MPEAPAWRFEKLIRPLFDLPTRHRILKGTLLTCVGKEVIKNGFVEIEGERIKAIGRAEDLEATDAEMIETDGTIMPGLFQNHAHLAWDGIHDLARQSIDDSSEISTYKCAGNMLLALRAGITSLRDMGMNKTNFSAKQAVEQGVFPGPRLYIAGQAIVQTGGHTYWCCREASGADEMRRAVREQVRGGADFIKIMGCHDRLEFTDAELDAVVDETHRNGLYITAHATNDACISRVLEQASIVSSMAVLSVTQQTSLLLLDRKVPIVTTFAPLVMQAQPEVARKFDIPEWVIVERQQAVSDPTRHAAIVKAAKAGVPIAFGTDAGSPAVPHDALVPELKYMLRLGVIDDNYAALRTMTAVSARVNRVERELGTLEPGKVADLIVIEGNPVEDLDALNRIRMTFIGGRRLITYGRIDLGGN